MNHHLRTALRFAAYIRAMGDEPIPFRHSSHREWAMALQRQHERLRRGLDPEVARAAKASAREVVRRKGYRVAAVEATPIRAGISDPQHDRVASSPGQQGAVMSAAAAQSASETEPLILDSERCRKRFHPDVWSAILHARHLGDGVQVYLCHCGGAHVGHSPDERTREYRRMRKRLRVIERRLTALDQEWIALVNEKAKLLRQVGDPDVLATTMSEIAGQIRRLAKLVRL